MTSFIGFCLQALLASINWGIYESYDNSLTLGCAVFTTLMALWTLKGETY